MCTVRRYACLVAIALVALTGCQTEGGFSQLGLTSGAANGDTAAADSGNDGRVSQDSYNFFFDQGDHLKELVAQPDGYTDAVKLYGEQRKFFDEPDHQKKYAPVLAQAAERLNGDLSPALDAAAQRLEQTQWPTAVASWPQDRKNLDAARRALQDYDAYALLDEDAYRADAANRLSTAIDRAEEAMTANAPQAFADFPHGADSDFFTSYPIDVTPKQILSASGSSLVELLNGKSSAELKGVAEAYQADMFGDDDWQAVSNRYVQLRRSEIADTSHDDLAAALQAIEEATDIGFKPSPDSGPKIAFVQITSRELLNEGAIDFPAAVEQDVPVTMTKATLSESLAEGGADGAPYLILFDVAFAKATRHVSGMKQVGSKYIAGYRQEPNPARAAVQNEVTQAQMELQTARMGQTMAANQYCPDLGCSVGRLISVLSEKKKVEAAQQKVVNLNSQLRTIPTTVDKPVYADYEFQAATVRARKAMTIHYYLVDKLKKRYFKSTFDVTEQQRFEIAYNVNKNDTEREQHLSDYDTEDDLDKWEKSASSVTVSQLLQHYLSHESAAKPLPPEATLRAEMMRDKNRALAQHKDETFEASTENDPRFDSVVKVYTGKGTLGTGFYVRPNVVMTNYHVVEELKFAEIGLHGGRSSFGKVIARDARLDLALIKVEADGKPVRFYDKNKLDLGSTIEVIGHPQNFDFSITRGVISAVRKGAPVNLPAADKVLLVQIDAPISPGNSGGPVFLGNKVVSIVSYAWVADHSQSLNFTIHYSEAVRFLEQSLQPRS